MKIFVGTNTLTMVDQQANASLNQLWFRLGRDFPQHQFFTLQPRRMSIDNMRNAAMKTALEYECDYVWFLDDDMIVDAKKVFPSMLEACEKYGFDIVMAETYIRGYPFEPMFFKHDGIERKLEPFRDYEKFVDKESGLLVCDAIGFACTLIKCDLIKKITKPYCATGVLGTEDIYFCMKARAELGSHNVKIGVDTKVPTGHLMDPEPVHKFNREAMKIYYETVYPHIKKEFKERENYDRSTQYAVKVKKVIKSRKAQIELGMRERKNKGRDKCRRGKELQA